jgi:hypothetical protein
VPITTTVVSPSIEVNPVPMQRVPETLGMPLQRTDPTYPYDGGPRQPVPLPGNLEPTQPQLPVEGRIISAPTQQTSGVSTARYTYPATVKRSGRRPIRMRPPSTSRAIRTSACRAELVDSSP